LLLLAASDDKQASHPPMAATNQPHTDKGYAVVSPPNSGEAETLYTKVFEVDPNTFVQRLQKVSSNYVTKTNSTVEDYERLEAYFTAAGAKLTDPGKMVFFHDRTGELLVRASLRDLEIIQRAIELLNQPYQQLTIESKFIEMDEASLRGVGFNWAKPEKEFTAILTDSQFRMAIVAMQNRSDTAVLAAPRITTLSGRQTHIGCTSETEDKSETEGVSLGIVATVEPDGYSIKTIATPRIYTISPKKKDTRIFDYVITTNLWDGQTLVIGSVTTNQLPEANNVRMVFITPTIIDPAGNRMHTDEQISNAARHSDGKK
jgi:type II secretory pathway component GspD/PulD (secretin)